MYIIIFVQIPAQRQRGHLLTACKIQNTHQGPKNGQQRPGKGRSHQLSLLKFFYPSMPSMRKGCDREWKMESEKNNDENSRLPERRQTVTPKLVAIQISHTKMTQSCHSVSTILMWCPLLLVLACSLDQGSFLLYK